MKFKQLISRVLLTGIFISNTGFSSLASTLSENGRYENFEGDYLTIDNIIENDKVDIEIEGNTLVNILGYENLHGDSGWTYIGSSGYMQLTDKTNTFKTLRYPLNKDIELNKEYTLFINITKNTMTGEGNTLDSVAKVSLAKDVGSDNAVYIQPSQTGIIKYVFRPTEIINNRPYITILPESCNGEFEYKDFMIIEGNHIDKDVEYFEGIKSIGEIEGDNYKLEVKSQNKNIFNGHMENGTYHYQTGKKIPYDTEIRSSEATPVEPGAIYTVSTNVNTPNIGIYQYDENFNFLNSDFPLGKTVTFTADKNCYFINIRVCGTDLTTKVQVEKGSLKTEYTKPEKDSYKLQLKEPLRGIEGGVKDRIVKRNGQWVIERNCGQKILNGKENWYGWHSNEVETHAFRLNFNKISHVPSSRKNTIISDTLRHQPFADIWYGNAILDKSISSGDPNGFTDRSSIYIRNTDFTTRQVDEFKEWLSRNPVTIVYELETPIYEPLNIPSSINIYEEITYISNDSIIPANMKVTIDRTTNNALETVDEALNISNINNISRARFWVNQMEESMLKDELQQKLNEILSLEDMGLERKSVSSNLDVYIKSQSMLSMSLDTNSVTFDGYSGTEDMEMLSVVNISINSSLPYSLNAYMPSDIANSDKSEIMPIDILNIRESSQSVYQTFTDTTRKIVLKDNCSDGNDLIHNIDLKLSSNLVHKADVYKTVIKFEAEQK